MAHKSQNQRISTQTIIERTRRILEREGKLSIDLINADQCLPDSHSVARRVGGLTPLYRMLGYVHPRNPEVAAARELITRWRLLLTGFVADWLADEGSHVERQGCMLSH